MTAIDRMIAEIESYLATASSCEQEERRILQALLEELKERRGNGKPAYPA
jgi:hypothetical protein